MRTDFPRRHGRCSRRWLANNAVRRCSPQGRAGPPAGPASPLGDLDQVALPVALTSERGADHVGKAILAVPTERFADGQGVGEENRWIARSTRRGLDFQLPPVGLLNGAYDLKNRVAFAA